MKVFSGFCSGCGHRSPQDSEIQFIPLGCQSTVCLRDEDDDLEEIEVDESESSTPRGRTRQLQLGEGPELSHGVELKGAYAAVEAPPGALKEEVDWLKYSTGNLFPQKGWDLVSLGGNMYGLKGRKISLYLLPPGSAPSKSYHLSHLRNMFSSEVVDRAAWIIVVDGPLRQPILDYLLQTGRNEEWESLSTQNNLSNVHSIHQNTDFVEAPPIHPEDRITAMTFARYHADVRHQASDQFLNGWAAGLFVEPPGRMYAGPQKGPQFSAFRKICGSPLDPEAAQIASQVEAGVRPASSMRYP